MYLLLLSIPFLNFLLLSLFSKNIWLENIQRFIIQSKFFLLILTFIAFDEIIFSDLSSFLNILVWFQSEILTIYWGFEFDGLVGIMLLVVSSISSCVHIYSLEYMGQDPHLRRFLSYIALFTFLMYILISANNLIQLFVGWEGVGLSSYLLINFWYNRLQANKAALKAMIVNRVGDIGLAIGIFLLFNFFGTIEYDLLAVLNDIHTNVYYKVGFINLSQLDIICICLLIGAVGKSAQIGLHVWLPDAMEGPTPVSALIHAATMVTAGVFLICRVSFLFENSLFSFFLICIVGSLTAFMAGTIGLVQNDLKKVIAYSTCSQLGYMVLVSGIGGYKEAMFHLTTHAFFKAGLFLGAGSLIHAVSDEQDMRKLGSLHSFIPFTTIVMMICSCSLCGMPFSAGFFSKDFILESAGSYESTESFFIYWIGFLTAVLTAVYSSRSLYSSFYDEVQGFKKIYENIHEGTILMLGPLFFLVLSGTTYGQLLFEIFLGYGNDIWLFLGNFKIKDSNFFNAEFLDVYFKQNLFYLVGLSITVFFILIFLIWKNILWETSLNNFFMNTGFYHFFNKKWYFDKLYNSYINSSVSSLGYKVTYQNLDRGVFEDMGPTGFSFIISKIAKTLKNVYFGILYQHLLLLILSFSLLLLIILSFSNF